MSIRNNRLNNKAESSRTALSTNQQNQRNMENSAIEASLAYKTRAVVEDVRPRNTAYAYAPKQEKFKVYNKKLHHRLQLLKLTTQLFFYSNGVSTTITPTILLLK